MTALDELLTLATDAARRAGDLLREGLDRPRTAVSTKSSPTDMVSEMDRAAEALLVDALLGARPDDGMVGEEGTDRDGSTGVRWIVDPLDGTTNFLHGIPHFAISIGLEREGVLVAGLVYNPATDELFTAEKGKGAFLNDRRRLRVAARRTLADAVVVTGIPHRGRPGHPRFLDEMKTVMMEVAGLRRSGSAALDLAYVAAGRYDGYWERGLKPWDLAAGIVLVREAGGHVSDVAGGDKALASGDVLAGNSAITKALLPLLAR